jgi:hypothetical protein
VDGRIACAQHVTEDGHIIFAVQWRSSAEHHKLTMLSSAWSCAEAEPYVTRSGRQVFQPLVVYKWYKSYGKVDQFNHKKVGNGKQGWEHVHKTRNRRNFPLFTGLLSMIDVNAYSATVHFHDVYKNLTHIEFRKILCEYLINNPYLEQEHQERTALQLRQVEQAHIPVNANTRSTCVICSRVHGLARYSDLYCTKCGINIGRFCRPGRKDDRGCWVYHVERGVPARTRTPNGVDA